jgi:hypothetical protein
MTTTTPKDVLSHRPFLGGLDSEFGRVAALFGRGKRVCGSQLAKEGLEGAKQVLANTIHRNNMKSPLLATSRIMHPRNLFETDDKQPI